MFKIYKEKTEKISIEREKIELIINKTKELGGENNIIQKAKKFNVMFLLLPMK